MSVDASPAATVRGESRWPMALAVLAIMALTYFLPDHLVIGAGP